MANEPKRRMSDREKALYEKAELLEAQDEDMLTLKKELSILQEQRKELMLLLNEIEQKINAKNEED